MTAYVLELSYFLCNDHIVHLNSKNQPFAIIHPDHITDDSKKVA